MMSNLDQYDWTIVGQLGNPVPGSEVLTNELAGRYATLRDNFRDMATTLKNLQSTSGMSGEWVAKFKEKVENLPGDFNHFADGFDIAQTELSHWSGELAHHQSKAPTELNNAQAAIDAQKRGKQLASDQQIQVNRAKTTVSDLKPDAPDWQKNQATRAQQEASRLLDSYKTQINDSAQQLDSAKQAIIRIRDEYEQDGNAHANAIGKAQSVAPSVHGFESVYYSDVWQTTVQILEVAGAVLGVVSLFFGGWILIAAAAVALLLAVNSLVEAANGDKSWTEAIFDVALAVLSVVPAVSAFSKISKASKAVKNLKKSYNAAKAAGRGVTRISKQLSNAQKVLRQARVDPTALTTMLSESVKNYHSLSNLKNVKPLQVVIKKRVGEFLKQSSAYKFFHGPRSVVDAVKKTRAIEGVTKKKILAAGVSEGIKMLGAGGKVIKPFLTVPTYEGQLQLPKTLPSWNKVIDVMVPAYNSTVDLPNKVIALVKGA